MNRIKKLAGSKAVLFLGILSTVAVCIAAVPGIFSSVNSTSGYQVNGAAGSSGQALCSDGTFYDTPCATSGGITALTGPVTAAGSGSVASTITPTGVTAGSYTAANITVNAAGQVTAASSTGGTSTTCSGSYPTESCYKIFGDGTKEAWGHISLTFPSGTLVTGSLSYPNTGGNAFTVVPALTLTVNDFTTDDAVTTYERNPTTAGGTVNVRCSVNIGGSGCSGGLSSTIPIAWRAIGQ